MKFSKGSKVYNKKTGAIGTVRDYPIHEAWCGYFTTEEIESITFPGTKQAFHDSDFCLVGSFEYYCIKHQNAALVILGIATLIYFITRLMLLFYV